MSDAELSVFYPSNYYSFTIDQRSYDSNKIFESPRLVLQKHFLKHFRGYSHLNVSGNFILANCYKLVKFRPFFYNNPEFIQNGNILDYGCGAGILVSFYQYLGWNAEGIEISKQATINAQKNGLNVRSGSIEQLDGYENYYDVIHSCHALEHVAEVDELFSKFYNSLKPGGYLVFEVPNGNAAAIDDYKDYYYYFGMPVHLNLFTQISAKSALLKVGFCNIQIDTYSVWNTQIASFYTKKKNKNSNRKFNLGSHTKLENKLGYIFTFITYIKSLQRGKGDNLIVIAQKSKIIK
jgi:2-polyprenyl-3-methyl-5-hydroxy-6-metoxy-1,4-benzoquinol methylase